MGRHSAWQGLLIASTIALAAAQTVQADPLPVPDVRVPQVSVPPVSVPPVSVPPVSVPQVSVPPVNVPPVNVPPQVNVPQVNVPQVNIPRVPVPQVSRPGAPQVSRPGAPQVSRPAAPQVTTKPRSNTPAPTRTQQRGVAPRPQTRSTAAPVRPAEDSGVSASSGAPRPTGDVKAGAKTPARHLGRTTREPSARRLRRLLKPLAACVATLGPMQERVLVRRAGLRGFKPQTRRELAKTLHTSRSRVAQIERRALGNLRKAVRAGGCAIPASSAPAPGTVSTSGTLVAERVSAPAENGGGGSASERGAVKGITESQSGSVIESAASAGRDALATISQPARSFADEHPLTFGLVVLATLLCGVLFVRELRRSV